jgi:hypothetical protein
MPGGRRTGSGLSPPLTLVGATSHNEPSAITVYRVRRFDVVLFWALNWPVNDRVGSFLWVPKQIGPVTPAG